jgi:thiol-disulfide isomerase/thioredoxin
MHANKKTKSQENSQWFKFSRILLCSLLLLAFGLQGCNDSPPANDNKPDVISGQPTNTTFPMPPIKPLGSMGWDLSEGRRGQLSEFRGKVLVLDFYATWCNPCRASVPHLVQIQDQYGSQGLQVVGLNVGGPDDLPEVPAFASEFKIQYPLGVPEDELSRFLLGDNTTIPQTFVFDRKGLLVRRLIGYGAETAKELDAAIKAGLQTPAD